MLDEKRVKLMARMASYEANEGKKYMNIGHYFRGDYITLQVIKSVICATIAFAICFGLYFFYDFERVMQDAYRIDLVALVKKFLLLYIALIGSYGTIIYKIYSIKYKKAKKSLKQYYNNLRKLSNMYD